LEKQITTIILSVADSGRKLITSANLPENKLIPSEYNLGQNYPNPFNPSTTIKYSLPEQSHVYLTIYNILGQRVQQLINEVQPAGYYHISWNASTLASGIYIYQLYAEPISRNKIYLDVKKMILLK
jgi:hypothetical protein